MQLETKMTKKELHKYYTDIFNELMQARKNAKTIKNKHQ